jgi:hypothetical protein
MTADVFSAGPTLLAIPLITLQSVVEVAVGGFLALYLTDVTRTVTRGFIVSTGAVLLVIGGLGVAGLFYLPDPIHLTDHTVDHSWLTPALRMDALFMGLFLLYLVAGYARPAPLRFFIGGIGVIAGVLSLLAAGLTYPTPVWGPAGSAVSFFLSAVTIGCVTTAMLLGHWYLVVPNLSTRPLFILLYTLAAGFILQGGFAAGALLRLAGAPNVASAHDIVFGSNALPFWMHIGAGVALPLVIVGLAWQSTRLRSLMSATGLLYVAVVLTLVGQITAKVIFYSGNLPL